MNLAGFRHVFDFRLPLTGLSDNRLGIAPVPVIALLKMASFQDRPADRERDLADIAHILDRFPALDDERRFSKMVYDRRLSIESAGPFVLGVELGTIVDGPERTLIEDFLGTVAGGSDGGYAQARMARLAPPLWNKDPGELIERLDAFALGLQSV